MSFGDSDSDSGESSDFAPGPDVTEMRLSPELSQAWAADHYLRSRVTFVAQALRDITGDRVRVTGADGSSLLELDA